ncbi:hypothetical protein ACFLUD_00225 [Chloroflexota bacterium]
MSEKQLLRPQELKEYLKKRTKNYLGYLRDTIKESLPHTSEILHSKYPFTFNHDYRYLNFHPGLEPTVRGTFILVADKRNKAFRGDNNLFDSFKKYLATARGECNKIDVFRISAQDIIEKFSGFLQGLFQSKIQP